MGFIILLKLTVSHYRLANKKQITGHGILPDFIVKDSKIRLTSHKEPLKKLFQKLKASKFRVQSEQDNILLLAVAILEL